MADNSGIEWTDATWNPVTGCSVVSPGCTNCYAMGLAGTRLRNHPSRAGLTVDSKAGPAWTGEVRLNEGWLDQPLRWSRPRRIFVCAHGDVFHESVPDEWIDRVFAVMALAPQHTFQVLTKRAARMQDYLTGGGGSDQLADRLEWHGRLMAAFRRSAPHQKPWTVQMADAALHPGSPWEGTQEPWFLRAKANARTFPLPNVWLGVSAEDQARADERIPLLLATPAAVRWVSAEPLLGPLDLLPYLFIYTHDDMAALECGCSDEPLPFREGVPPAEIAVPRLDWVVAGGESGKGARPMHPDWARGLRDQCAGAAVPFFFKQWGEWVPQVGGVDGWTIGDNPEISRFDHRDWEGERWGEPYRPMWCDERDDDTVSRIGKKAAGALLDGVEHKAFPA